MQAESADLNHPVLNRGFEQLGGIGHPDLFHHGGSMSLYGLDADLQALSDLAVLQPGPNKLEDFLLSIGQCLRSFSLRRQISSLLCGSLHWVSLTPNYVAALCQAYPGV